MGIRVVGLMVGIIVRLPWWNCVLWISLSNGIFFFLVLLFYNHIIFVKVMGVLSVPVSARCKA